VPYFHTLRIYHTNITVATGAVPVATVIFIVLGFLPFKIIY
jgi:hypothetical protein